LGDGMAEEAIPELGGKSPMQVANTPYMDLLALKGCSGMLATIPEGFAPGSEIANLSLLGYDVRTDFEGRGSLEAASIGVALQPGEMAMRCNLLCIQDSKIKNHSAGHISNDEAAELVHFLEAELGSELVKFHVGISYRHLMVLKSGTKKISCTPPHDVPGTPFKDVLVKALVPEAQATADTLNRLILRSQELLANKNLFVPDKYFQGSLDDFWATIGELDGEFEEKRQVLASQNKRFRFVAKMENGACSVGLQEVSSTHPFYDLEGSNNIILITTERYLQYPMMIKGYGAGASVTAAGVFADIISIANIR